MGVQPAITVTEPPVPFHRATKATSGRLYTIVGMVPAKAHRFSVNFCIDGVDGSRALHLDNRLDKKTIVRNSFSDNVWGKEEKQGSYFPLALGHAFELMILVDELHFKIAYNGSHFAEFSHRQSPRLIDTINIGGDVIITTYRESEAVEELSGRATTRNERQIVASHSKFERRDVYELPVGLNEKSVLRIVAIPFADFEFNLTASRDVKEIGLHLNYRRQIDTVVLNSRHNEQWEEELRPNQIAFRNGEHFDLAVSVRGQALRLQVNDGPIAFFPIRHHPASSLNHLLVDGDVRVVWVSQEDADL